MILRGDLKDLLDEVVSLYEYHPYWIFADGQKTKNPDADEYTYKIMDLKDNSAQKQRGVIEELAKFLGRRLEENIAIVVVPSHDPEKRTSGIRKLASALATDGRIDACTCLVRHTKVPKKSGGGDRNIEVDLNSIRVENIEVIENRPVLLLDDVTTK